MMKKYFAFVLMLVSLISCSKKLEPQEDDRVDSWLSVYEHYSRLNNNIYLIFYNNLYYGTATGLNQGGFMLSGYCDEAQASLQTGTVYDWYDGRSSASQMPLAYAQSSYNGELKWNKLYENINLCNTAITCLTSSSLKPNYPEAHRREALAQAYANRAYAYLMLVTRWGDIPIVKRTYTEVGDPASYRKASFAAVADAIMADCDSVVLAQPNLDWFAGVQSNFPTIPQGALEAMRSRIALYAASPLWADDHDADNAYTWKKAAKITKDALDAVLAHNARLFDANTSFPNTSDSGYGPYDKYFLSSYPMSLSWDTETLYQPFYYGAQPCSFWQYNGLPLDAGQIYAGACPTQEMVDAYEVVSSDGTQAAPLLDLAKPYNADGTPNFNQAALDLGYVDCSAKMYKNRDPRFYGSIYYDGASIIRNGAADKVNTYVGGNCGLSLAADASRYTCTGYYLRKFHNADSGVDNGNKDGYFRYFRLAELYLNFAEAAYMAYGPDVKVNGMSAREAVNAVRARVGMPGITETGDAFLLRLKNERRVELAFEEHRFFDVRRWTRPDGDLRATDAVVHGIRITVQGGVRQYARFSFDRQCYENKYLKYPIDIQEVRRMLHLTGLNWQNRGWD
ncbi:MAG: RagB/SusD family nutrient uptake outer membrane protein [Bacteroidales bacterium]|nr:RagB/SusD family nutrient uptake outer membrane protein [Bacteroidales bacterium]